MNLIEMVILSLVQGLTEWLPISSSGHIVIVQQLLGFQTPLIVNITLHFGTLISAFVFFRNDIRAILGTIPKMEFQSVILASAILEKIFSTFVLSIKLPVRPHLLQKPVVSRPSLPQP